MSTKVSGKAGVPLLSEGSVEVTAGLEITGEDEFGTVITDGQTTSTTSTETHSQTVSVPPKKRIRGIATFYSLQVQGVKWTGKMTVTYAGGGKKTFPTDGTFDSVNASETHTSFEEEDL